MSPKGERLRLLAILEGGERYPSGVVRGTLYRDHFLADGIQVEYVSRTPFESIERLEKARGPLGGLLRSRHLRNRYLDRAWRDRFKYILERARSADAVYLSKVTSLEFVQAVRGATAGPVVLDFGDAVWLAEDRRMEPRFQDLLRLVDAVTTDNELTAAYVRRFNDRCVVVPDSPQVESFDRVRGARRQKSSGVVTLGWIGSEGTAYNLFAIWEALEKIGRCFPRAVLRLVGTGDEFRCRTYPPFENIRYTTVPAYDQQSMIDEIFAFDIGLFPLQDVERSRVRGVLKATVYMCGEAAVVASPVGQLRELIRDGGNGLLAASHDEWVEKIALLIDHPEERRRLVEGGLATVREGFTTVRSYELLKNVILSTKRRS